MRAAYDAAGFESDFHIHHDAWAALALRRARA